VFQLLSGAHFPELLLLPIFFDFAMSEPTDAGANLSGAIAFPWAAGERNAGAVSAVAGTAAAAVAAVNEAARAPTNAAGSSGTE
jgi:hypothetical protein